MLSRLNFELYERQRFVWHLIVSVYITSNIMSRLDQRRKELLEQKEELLKQNKTKLNTLDSVKAYIDALTKVCFHYPLTLLVIHGLVQTASETQKKLDELVVQVPSES